MRTRKAILPDAKDIHELISAYSGDGTLLPRTLAEICENVRDFVVLENDGRIIGCGALHLYGTTSSSRLHLPLHPGSRIFCAPGIRDGTARGSSRQDLQGLPRLPQVLQVR